MVFMTLDLFLLSMFVYLGAVWPEACEALRLTVRRAIRLARSTSEQPFEFRLAHPNTPPPPTGAAESSCSGSPQCGNS